ncbi:hypothetical protein [Actinomadura chibensis]|uniref:Uncharacterized protein n=1 Tax=Actinomadura chibensis TaxID=392828 RepID=A0A5D0N258_9ACTN|nr:hypothetical protein [Actinomadura chibensis]TYB38418.1 hypothetical protein FXF69_41510 [Actinomadura chibensis]
MDISPDAARSLAGALLQLNPLLGLGLIWTETRLRERETPSRGGQRRRQRNTQQQPPQFMDRLKGQEWLIFVIFLHSITWQIIVIADPTTIRVKVALGISIIWISFAVMRIVSTITLTGRREKITFWLVMTTTWYPLWGAVVTIQVDAKPDPRPAVVTPATPRQTP